MSSFLEYPRNDGTGALTGFRADPQGQVVPAMTFVLADGGQDRQPKEMSADIYSPAGAARGPVGKAILGGTREITICVCAAVVYFGGRVLVEGSSVESTANAQRLIDFEQTIGIDVEQWVQRFALDNGLVRTLGNLSYVWLHWPLLVVILSLLFNIDRRRYYQLRNALFGSGIIGLALFAIWPMSPPRFMPGFVGTVSDEARRHYLKYPLTWTNRFAAFPSFHVGWTLIACVALAASLHHDRLRWLALLPAALVALAVISTGNHYVVDAVVGGGIAASAYGIAGRSWSEASRAP